MAWALGPAPGGIPPIMAAGAFGPDTPMWARCCMAPGWAPGWLGLWAMPGAMPGWPGGTPGCCCMPPGCGVKDGPMLAIILFCRRSTAWISTPAGAYYRMRLP